MTQQRFQFRLVDALWLIASAACLMELIRNPDGSIGFWLVGGLMIALTAYWYATGRIKVERRALSRTEVRRLLLTIAGLVVATIVIGAIVITTVVKFSRPYQ
jgi:hypothetical protein